MRTITATELVTALVPDVFPAATLVQLISRLKTSGAGELHVARWLAMRMPGAVPISNEWDDFKAAMLDTLKHGNVVLLGPRGCGKSQLAVEALAEQVQKKGDIGLISAWQYPKQPRMLLLSEMSQELRETFTAESDKSEKSVMDKFAQAALLIVDELQDGSGTTFSEQRLTDAIALRYRNGLPTIFASNVPESALSKAVGPTIASRFQEGGSGCLVCEWSSLRTLVPNVPPLHEITEELRKVQSPPAEVAIIHGVDDQPRGGLKLKGR